MHDCILISLGLYWWNTICNDDDCGVAAENEDPRTRAGDNFMRHALGSETLAEPMCSFVMLVASGACQPHARTDIAYSVYLRMAYYAGILSEEGIECYKFLRSRREPDILPNNSVISVSPYSWQ